MKMHEPLGNALYAALLARIPISLFFIFAGYAKLANPGAFVMEVQKFGILPEPLATLFGILLPYVEIVSGVFLLIGIWTTLAALLMSLMLVSFIIAMGPFSGEPFNKDIVLLGVTLSFLYSGGGGWSVDRFRKSG